MGLARIGIGSNSGDAAAHVRSALGRLSELGRVTARSSLYRTAAWGVTEQPDFINAAALLQTALEPYALLGALKTIETQLGRVATFRWGPRVIDLDILAYEGVEINEPQLTLPHPRLHERAFALAPLTEIDPAYAPLLDRLSTAERAQAVRLVTP